MKPEVVDNPTNKPLTVTLVKEHLKITHDHEDTLLDRYIDEAWEYGERISGHTFLSTTFRQWVDVVPQARMPWWDGVMDHIPYMERPAAIELARYPVTAINSIKVYDKDNNETEVDATIYRLNGSVPGEVVLNDEERWPEIIYRSAGAMAIEFVAGHGTEPSDAPKMAQEAMLRHIAHLYTSRGDVWSQGHDNLKASGALEIYKTMRLNRLV